MSENVVRALREAVRTNPDDPELWIHLGRALAENGELDDALDAFKNALAVDPVSVKAAQGALDCTSRLHDPAADSYRRLVDALGGVTEQVPAASVTAPTDGGVEEPDSPTFLRVLSGGAEEADSDEFNERWVERQAAVTTMSDVVGLESVKRRLELAFLGPIRNPEVAGRYGKRMRGGLLLYGPPGCGKTFLARALAGELGARFIPVGLHDVLDMWLGNTEKNVHALFEAARESAPSVVFLDELDALGRKRSALTTDSSRNVVNQLLAEMDGITTSDLPVFVLGATNLPWDVDSALRRPGRFDRAVFVKPPDSSARAFLIEMMLRRVPAEKIDAAFVAKRTEGYSTADVKYVCEAAIEFAMERAIETGTESPVSMRDIKNALKETKPSIRGWLETARNYATFSNTSGNYDDLSEYLASQRF